MATTQEAIDELKVAVGDLGTAVNAALDRLEQGKDDPEEIAAATAELRTLAGKISEIATTPSAPPEEPENTEG